MLLGSYAPIPTWVWVSKPPLLFPCPSSLGISLCLHCAECLSWEAFQLYFHPRCFLRHFVLYFSLHFHSHVFIFSPTSSALSCPPPPTEQPASPSPPSLLSWRGHTQGSNESTRRCLQETRFHRPSWITVTMEISATVVTHAYMHRCDALDSSDNKCNHSETSLLWAVCCCSAPREQLPATHRCLQGPRRLQWTA